jgi:hypothetical protein
MSSRRRYADCASATPEARGRSQHERAERSRRWPALAALLAALATVTGCASIHSEAVRDLIDRQAKKTAEASQASKVFVEQTGARIELYNKGVADLDKSLLELRRQESVFALALASAQPVATKTGIDARAFGYQAGLLYLDTQAGLDQAVMKQFEEDFATMQALSRQIAASWESQQELQAQLTAYAQQSSIASADRALVSAVLEQAHVSPKDVGQVIQRSKQVNKALEKASGYLPAEETGQARGYLQDLIQLLESSKKP